MLIPRIDTIPNYFRTKVPLLVVEAMNGNIKATDAARARLQKPALPAA